MPFKKGREMKVEVGKTYKSRDGRLCFIYAKPAILRNLYLFVRVELDSDELEKNKLPQNRYMCYEDGTCYNGDVNKEDQETLEMLSQFDLIEEIK